MSLSLSSRSGGEFDYIKIVVEKTIPSMAGRGAGGAWS